jgi:hypothetical protein
MTQTYQICTSIPRVQGADRLLCVVAALPGPGADAAVEVESRIASSESAARACCAALMRELAERIRGRGGLVLLSDSP